LQRASFEEQTDEIAFDRLRKSDLCLPVVGKARIQGHVRMTARPSLPEIPKLEAIREHPVLVYNGPIEDAAVPVFSECLRRLGVSPRLDIVLFTGGGSVTVARRLALLLREFAEIVTVIVPASARSAGTLLALSADEILMTASGELGPIDAHIFAEGPASLGPDSIGAEDVRLFSAMAEEWFGVTSESKRFELLALIAQRVFPLSLSTLYRSSKLTRQVARELLDLGPLNGDNDRCNQLINRLTEGYWGHDVSITRRDATLLGLPVVKPTSEEEALLISLRDSCRREFLETIGRPGEKGILGLVMSRNACAVRLQSWSELSSGGPGDGDRGGTTSQVVDVAWRWVSE
jgi:hypothetical protein